MGGVWDGKKHGASAFLQPSIVEDSKISEKDVEKEQGDPHNMDAPGAARWGRHRILMSSNYRTD